MIEGIYSITRFLARASLEATPDVTSNLFLLALSYVWEKQPWKKLNSGIEEKIHRSSKQYSEAFKFRYGNLKILGMEAPIGLEEIYIPVKVSARNFENIISNLSTIQKTIYPQPRINTEHNSRDRLIDGLSCANQHQFLTIVGSPGMGKSIFLRTIGLYALNLAEGKGYEHKKVPIYIDITREQNKGKSIDNIILAEFQTCNLPDAQIFCQTALAKGDLLILIDGIDELKNEQQSLRISEIKDHVDKYSDNRYIISRRKAAQSSFTSRFIDVYIARFSQEDASIFIRKWLDSRKIQENIKAELKYTIQKYSSREIHQFPLLLMFICLKADQIPQDSISHAPMYSGILNLLLSDWLLEKGEKRSPEILFRDEVKKRILTKIAYEMTTENRIFIFKKEILEIAQTFDQDLPSAVPGATIVDELEHNHGILIRQSDDICSFRLTSIQEYLAACHISTHKINLEELIDRNFKSLEWKRIIKLLCGIDRSDRLLKYILAHLKKQIQSTRLHRLINWSREYTIIPEQSGSKSLAMSQALFICFELFSLYALQSPFRNSIFSCNKKIRSIICNLDQSSNIHHLIDPKIISAVDTKVLIEISIRIVEWIKENKLFNQKINLENLENRLRNIHRKLGTKRIKGKSKVICINYVYTLWISALKLDSESLNFSWHDINQVKEYLSGYLFLLKCREQSLDISAETWLKIEDEVFSL
jgi:hypothetical protein